MGNRDAMNADVADSQTPAAPKTADGEASPPLSAVEQALYEGRFDTRDSMLLEVGLPIALLVVGVVLHIADAGLAKRDVACGGVDRRHVRVTGGVHVAAYRGERADDRTLVRLQRR